MTRRIDGLYNVNIKRLALLTLPTWLRRPLVSALLYGGVTPLARLVEGLRSFRVETSYRVSHNGQVCKLRGLLNDTFDSELRRISIEEGGATELCSSVVWKREAERWAMLPRRGSGAVHLNRVGYGGTGGYDFWVVVPASVISDERRLCALVNMYKLAGKRFAINYK